MWIVVPSECCRSAPGCRDLIWAWREPHPEPAFFVTSSVKPSALPSSWRGWKKRPWSRRLFGAATLGSLTVARGEAESTSLPRATHDLASHSAQRASAAEPATPATCGPTSLESSETPTPRSPFLRTSEDTFRLGSPTSLATLPSSGSMRLGVVSPRARLERPTDGSDSSCWPIGPNYPTPDSGLRSGFNTGGANPGPSRPTLEQLGKNWMTPRANDAKGSTYMHGGIPTLCGRARNWKTPHGMGGKDKTGKLGSGGEFAKQATDWATPHANCTTGAGSQGREGGDNLQTQASGLPAPETPKRGDESSQSDPTSRRLYQTPRAGKRGPPGESARHGGQPKGKRLNPRFVSALMGLHYWWTEV